ncbi:hypothetical protein FQA39_LY10753 [Lamprigera yunnana]|nr:hypothetical protein FQA39_LY10753 [Lamprigera yunnana]
MLKLNESTYLNIDPNVHHGPLNILLKKVGQPQQMKLKTIPVLHNIQPNMALHSDMHQPVSILASYLSSATSLPQTLISSPEKSNTNSKTKYAHVKNVPKCQKIRILRYKPNYGTELLNNANRKRLSTISTSQIEDTSKRNPAPQLERSKNISYQTKISGKIIVFHFCSYSIQDVIKEILKLNDKESKPKITEEAVELVKEITKALVVESAMRAARQASLENKSTVTLENVETMLLQLVSRFFNSDVVARTLFLYKIKY